MGGQIIVIGAGAAGLSAALSLADKNIKVLLVSDQPSERAQSVMAEGGMNAALISEGSEDSVQKHAEETLQAGRNLADRQAVGGYDPGGTFNRRKTLFTGHVMDA